jgi:hypothetical protein
MDLASGHTKALDKLFTTPDVGKYDLSFIQACEADSRFTRVGENVCSPCFHTVSELGACWAFRFLATTTSITVVHMPASKARIFLISCWFILWYAGCEIYNLGTGRGTSVLEMVSAFEKASGKVGDIHVFPGYWKSGVCSILKSFGLGADIRIVLILSQKIPLRYDVRRPGDSSEVYAATEKAENELDWRWFFLFSLLSKFFHLIQMKLRNYAVSLAQPVPSFGGPIWWQTHF